MIILKLYSLYYTEVEEFLIILRVFSLFTGGFNTTGHEVETVQNLLSALRNKRVATFGDSDPFIPGDWVQIILSRLPSMDNYKDSSSDTNKLTGTCHSVVTSLHMEIAYSKIGSFANPQSKILGVNYNFGASRDIKFECIGFGACKSPSKTQRIEISSSVEFIDVTRAASNYYAEYPIIEARLPYDFFYPFITPLTSRGMKNSVLTANIYFFALFHLFLKCSIWPFLSHFNHGL